MPLDFQNGGADNIPANMKKNNAIQEHIRPLLFRLFNRAALFLTLLTVVLLMLYVTGNRQLFLDKDQTLILKLCTITSTALALVSIIALCQSVFLLLYTIKKNIRNILFYFRHVIAFLLMLSFSAAVLIITRSITFIAAGM